MKKCNKGKTIWITDNKNSQSLFGKQENNVNTNLLLARSLKKMKMQWELLVKRQVKRYSNITQDQLINLSYNGQKIKLIAN